MEVIVQEVSFILRVCDSDTIFLQCFDTIRISFLMFDKCILSQSYNATVFYFDNVSFPEHALNQLFLPNKSSISPASYHTMVLTICFQQLKKQTILLR